MGQPLEYCLLLSQITRSEGFTSGSLGEYNLTSSCLPGYHFSSGCLAVYNFPSSFLAEYHFSYGCLAEYHFLCTISFHSGILISYSSNFAGTLSIFYVPFFCSVFYNDTFQQDIN